MKIQLSAFNFSVIFLLFFILVGCAIEEEEMIPDIEIDQKAIYFAPQSDNLVSTAVSTAVNQSFLGIDPRTPPETAH